MTASHFTSKRAPFRLEVRAIQEAGMTQQAPPPMSRWLWTAMAALALTLSVIAPGRAQVYPAQAITLVVPFAAGSGTDSVARVVAKKLGERMRQPVLVENRAGANGQIAAVYVAKAKPDGYTLLMTTNTSHSANPSLVANLKYDPVRDFTPVVRLGELPFALVVNATDPARSLRDWIDNARRRPGQLSYATPNSTSLVASETIKRIAGLDIISVPYKSSPQALTDLIGGSVQMYVVDLGSGMAMIKAGSVRALGVTTQAPLASLPGVPPIATEVQGFDLTSWNGVFGPAGLPRSVVDRLNLDVQAVLADADVRDALRKLGFEIWPSASPEEFARYVSDQLAHWGQLIRQAGIRPE